MHICVTWNGTEFPNSIKEYLPNKQQQPPHKTRTKQLEKEQRKPKVRELCQKVKFERCEA